MDLGGYKKTFFFKKSWELFLVMENFQQLILGPDMPRIFMIDNTEHKAEKIIQWLINKIADVMTIRQQ